MAKNKASQKPKAPNSRLNNNAWGEVNRMDVILPLLLSARNCALSHKCALLTVAMFR